MTLPDLQVHMVGTRLTTPVVVDGRTYTWGAVAKPAPSTNNEGTEIVTGTIHSVTAVGGGVYDLFFDGDWQWSSFTKVVEGQGPSEIEYRCSCGGNIANPRDRERVLSWNNAMATRGSLAGIRVQAGDGAGFTRAGKDWLFEVLEEEAYAQARAAVDYTGDAVQAGPQWIDADVTQVGVNLDTTATDGLSEYVAGSRVFFDPDAAGVLGLYCYVLLYDGVSVYTAATRYVFNNPESGLDEENWLPADWGNGISGSQYWWDAAAKEARLLSDCGADGPTAILGYWLKGATIAPGVDNDCIVAVEVTTAGAGLDDGGDGFVMSGWTIGEAFDEWIVVREGGIVCWRESTTVGSPLVGVTVTDGGAWAMVLRNVEDGALSTIASGSYTLPFYVRVVKSGANVDVYTKQNSGDAWTLAGSEWPSGLADGDMSGLMGFGRGDEGVASYTLGGVATQDRTLYLIGEAVGEQHVSRVVSSTFATSRVYARGHVEAITEVRNETTGTVMSSSATARRDHYTLSGTDLVFYAESSGDRIKVTYEAPAVGTGPGWAPRTFNQPHFAEFAGDEGDPQLASTDLAENRANKRDRVRVRCEWGFVPAAGETVTFWRGRGVWSAEHRPVIKWDDRADALTTWATLEDAAANYLVRCYQGLVLLEESVHAGLPATFCLQAEARRYRGGVDKTVWNEPKAGLEMLDNLWFDVGVSGGSAVGMQGTCTKGLGTVTYTRRTIGEGPYETFWPTGWVECGDKYIDFDTFYGIGQSGPTSWYASMNYGYTGAVVDQAEVPNESYDIPAENQVVGYKSHHELWGDQTAGQIYFEVNPFESNPDPGFGGVDNWCGSYVSEGTNATDTSASFSFNAVPFAPGEKIKRLPEGATILAARLRVKFNGLKYQSWTMSAYGKWRFSALLEGSSTVMINGINQAVITPEQMLLEEGAVGMTLVGIRRTSRYIVDNTGAVVLLPAYDIISTGPSVQESGTVASGEWGVINVTNLVQTLYRLINSEVAYDGFLLVPTVGNPDFDSGEFTIRGYLQTLLPYVVTTFTDSFPDYWETTTAKSGAWFGWSSMEIGKCVCRVRLASGVVEDRTLPLIMPRA